MDVCRVGWCVEWRCVEWMCVEWMYEVCVCVCVCVCRVGCVEGSKQG